MLLLMATDPLVTSVLPRHFQLLFCAICFVSSDVRMALLARLTFYSTTTTVCWAEPAPEWNRTPEGTPRQPFLGQMLMKSRLKATITSEIRRYRSRRIIRESNYTRVWPTAANRTGRLRQVLVRKGLGAPQTPTVPGALGARVPAGRSDAPTRFFPTAVSPASYARVTIFRILANTRSPQGPQSGLFAYGREWYGEGGERYRCVTISAFQVNAPSFPIPASYMVHVFRQERPGQHRGIPEITPALPLFAQLRRFILAVLSAAEAAADYAGVVCSVLEAARRPAVRACNRLQVSSS